MRRLMLACVFSICSVALSQVANATSILGEFVQTGSGLTTSPFVFPDPFDTWEFRITGHDPVEAIELDFSGNFIQSVGGVDFLEGSALPVVFGFIAPETFFVTRVGDLTDVLAAPGTTFDTTSQLASAYTLAGKFIDDGPGIATTIALFSVPAGSPAPELTAGQGAVGGNFQPVTLIPEPASFVLAGFGLLGMMFGRRRRC